MSRLRLRQFFDLPLSKLRLSLVGDEKCVARNNPARKFFEFILAGVGLARKKSKISLLGQSWQEKSQNFPCLYKFLAKIYKFLAKMHQNESIPCHGDKNIILIPPRGAWQGKYYSNSLPGHPGEVKSGFQTRGILTIPRPVPPYPAKGCLGDKNAGP